MSGLTERHEDDEGKSIAKNKFQETGDSLQKAAKEDVATTTVWISTRAKSLGWQRQDIYIPAAPSPPAPLQPIKSQDRGVRHMQKPMIALRCVSHFPEYIEKRTYKGVGLPKMRLRSPWTLVFGAR